MRTTGYLKNSTEIKRFERNLSYHWYLVWRVGIMTGLRISDILCLKVADLSLKMHITERKTGKERDVELTRALLRELILYAGKQVFVFQSPRTGKPYTRQAAWAAMVKAAHRAHVSGHLAPHSARKVFARDRAKLQTPEQLQREFGHTHIETTLLYIFS